MKNDVPAFSRLHWSTLLHRTGEKIDEHKIRMPGRIGHSGAPYQRKAVAFFSYTYTQDFLSLGAIFFSQKVDDLFSRRRRRYV